MQRLLSHGKNWFSEYVWRFKTGKAGTLLTALACLLDFHSRVQTFFQEVAALPQVITVAASPWFHLVLFVAGLLLIYRSTRVARGDPRPIPIPERITSLEGTVGSIGDLKLADSLREVRNWLSTINGVIHKTPPLVMFLADIAELSCEVDYGIRMLEGIRTYDSQSEVFRAPFSQAWKPEVGDEPRTETVRMGVAFRNLLRAHVERSRLFAATWHLEFGEYFQKLFVGVSSSLGSVSGTECLDWMRRHQDNLMRERKEHAAKFSDPVLSFTTSKTDQS